MPSKLAMKKKDKHNRDDGVQWRNEPTGTNGSNSTAEADASKLVLKKKKPPRNEGFKLRKQPTGKTGFIRPAAEKVWELESSKHVRKLELGPSKDDHKELESEGEEEEEKELRVAISRGESGNKTFSSGRFHDLGLDKVVADHVHGFMAFTAPTHIQQEAIPVILTGKDVLVNAGTGTGKTLVYLAAIVNALQGKKKKVNRADGTYALVLVPTRELCVQVFSVAQKLVHRFIWLVPGSLMGGENKSKEKARLRKGVTILIATPGRLLDHLKLTQSFKLDNLRWLVFDEADRLLDMGFEKDVRSILSLLGTRQNLDSGGDVGSHDHSRGRQHILLSATLNERVNELAELSLKEPVTIGIQSRETTAHDGIPEVGDNSDEAGQIQQDMEVSDGPTEYNIPSQLSQCYYKIPAKLRLVGLLAMLQQRSVSSASSKQVIFFSTCDAVDFHFSLIQEFHLPPGLNEKNYANGPFLKSKLFRLHGNMPQKERTEAFVQFGQSTSAVLVCTDVASRGLDFKGVTCIVQYDPPGDAADYVHRVGRTARLGREGEAILCLQPCELGYIAELQKHGVSLKELPLGKLLDVLPTDRTPRKRKQAEESVGLESHPVASYMHLALETFVSKKERNVLAAKAFGSYLRAYAAHKADLKPIFQVHKLHLGHVAKSFGLSAAPSTLGNMGKKAPKGGEQRVVKRADERVRKRQRLHAATMEE